MSIEELKKKFPWNNIHFLLIAIIVISIPVTVLISRQKESVNRNVLATQEESIRDLTNDVLGSGKTSSLTQQSATTDSFVISKAQKRKDMMLKLANDDPAKFLLYALPSNVTDKLNPLVKESVEKEVEVSGEIKIIHSDDFEGRKSTNELQLETVDSNNKPSQTYSLSTSQNLPKTAIGGQVRVKAYQLDNKLVLKSSNDAVKVTSSFQQPTTGVQRTLVMMVNFQSDPAEILTPNQIDQMVFSGPNSVKNYYEGNSYGQTHFTGDVVGYYTLPMSNAACARTEVAKEANEAAIAHGVDPLAYTRWVYVFPHMGSCGAGGVSTLGRNPSKSWIFLKEGVGLYNYPDVIAHELGHQLGVMHASAMRCGNQTFGNTGDESDCQFLSYADKSDIMGSGQGGTHIQMNGPHKEDLGWLSSSQAIDVNSSGNFTISRLEDTTPGLKVIRIPIPTSDAYYYLSYRQPIGLDSAIQSGYTRGVSIQRKRDNYNFYGASTIDSLLLDSTPGNDPILYNVVDSALGDNETITDSINGITINQIGHDSVSASVQVTIDKSVCRRGVPDVSVSPISQVGPAGQGLQYVFSVRNNDTPNCPATTFNMSFDTSDPVAQPSWAINGDRISITLSPGQSGNVTKTLTPMPATPEGIYIITSHFKSSEPRHSLELKYSILVTWPPITPTPSPTPTNAPTPTPTKSPTPTPTKVPTPTPTLPPGTITLNPMEDTYIDQSTSTTNYGKDNKLMVSAIPKTVSYMTFDISKVKGRRITKATLFLNIAEVKGTNPTASFLIKETPTTWNEKTLTYAIRAPLGVMVGYFPKPNNLGEIKADLSNWLLGISGKDKISIGIESNANSVRIKSREVLNDKPYLVIDYQ